ncbi:LexA family protein, partial [Pseudomonas typographi]|nr:peptidase S24 [Pseudomonas typographi]
MPAGFPSPATDHLEKAISLDELLNLRAPHIYLVRIEGDSMIGAGIFDGDLVVVDRAIEPAHGHIV